MLSAIKSSASEKVGIESHTEKLLSSASEAISEAAKRESQKSEKDIYNEVFIDEINQELLNSVMKTQGDTVVLLVKKDRLLSFSDVWKDANLDYYNTQAKQTRSLQEQVARV